MTVHESAVRQRVPRRPLADGAAARLAWRETRPCVQVIFALRFLAGALLAGGTVSGWRLLTAGVGWSCVVAAIYLHNGTTDVVEDRRNGSARPLATGELPLPAARAIVRGLAVAGLTIAALADPREALLALAMLALGFAYSSGRAPLKGSMPGFALVVLGGGMLTYTAGGLTTSGGPTLESAVFALFLSAWMAVAGSSKDLSDTDGDRSAGRRTLPVMFGQESAARMIAAGTLTVGALFVAVAVHVGDNLIWYALPLAAGAAVTAATLLRTRRATLRADRRLPYRSFMVTQFLVHGTVLAVYAATAGLLVA
ncbi:UbiA family prenyltransferase [Actinoplanes oblitus]|uniref:UbiA family prenyltransferase n=1 Tax=Actinoplanes oblitus TaxID=3040509 RepID=A0ABY8WDR2_9ACTN|nr:UbiA family prenyltransferase [Actinoplanes oblitus]WIM94529.1 UbiA family prenyltransferase [Actinoplanes oblitus]